MVRALCGGPYQCLISIMVVVVGSGIDLEPGTGATQQTSKHCRRGYGRAISVA